MSVSNQIKKVRELSKLNQEEFAAQIGVSRSTLSQIEIERVLPSIEVLRAVSRKFHVDYSFLLDAEEGKTLTQIAKEDLVKYERRTDRQFDQQVPLYNLEATAGLVPLFKDHKHQNPVDFLSIPHLPKCDGAIYVTGDSMYPLLKSGDIVCYKQITDYENDIFFGEMYLISVKMAGEEYISVKWVQKSDLGPKHIKLVSQNQHHQEKDIAIANIAAMALVKASIRINSMG